MNPAQAIAEIKRICDDALAAQKQAKPLKPYPKRKREIYACADCGAPHLREPQNAYEQMRCPDCQKRHHRALAAERQRRYRASRKAVVR